MARVDDLTMEQLEQAMLRLNGNRNEEHKRLRERIENEEHLYLSQELAAEERLHQ